MHGFLHEMRKCCIFHCAENRCWGCRELKKSLSLIWSSVLAYVYGVPFYYLFPIYVSPKFIFGYPNISWLSDIHNSIFGHPKMNNGYPKIHPIYTVVSSVMILSFRTDMPGQTVQTQIRLLLIRVYTVCHSFCVVWIHYSMVEPHSSNFRVITTNFLGVRIFRKFMVVLSWWSIIIET